LTKAETLFREFVITQMKRAPVEGWSWYAIRDSGAEVAGCSLGTAKGYMQKLHSPVGDYVAEWVDAPIEKGGGTTLRIKNKPAKKAK